MIFGRPLPHFFFLMVSFRSLVFFLMMMMMMTNAFDVPFDELFHLYLIMTRTLPLPFRPSYAAVISDPFLPLFGVISHESTNLFLIFCLPAAAESFSYRL